MKATVAQEKSSIPFGDDIDPGKVELTIIKEGLTTQEAIDLRDTLNEENKFNTLRAIAYTE